MRLERRDHEHAQLLHPPAVACSSIVPCSIERTPFAIATLDRGRGVAVGEDVRVPVRRDLDGRRDLAGRELDAVERVGRRDDPARGEELDLRRAAAELLADRPADLVGAVDDLVDSRSGPGPPGRGGPRGGRHGRRRGRRSATGPSPTAGSAGRGRGPFSTAFAQAGSSPPASRTVVKPSSSAPSMYSATRRTWSISGSSPWSPFWPMSAKWTWASVRPGMSVAAGAVDLSRAADRRALGMTVDRGDRPVADDDVVATGRLGAGAVEDRDVADDEVAEGFGRGVGGRSHPHIMPGSTGRGGLASARSQGSGRQRWPSRIASASRTAPIATNATLTSTTSWLDDQVGRELLEDVVELLGALGRVVLAAGRVGDRVERVLVDRPPEPAAGPAEPPPPNPPKLPPGSNWPLSPGSLPMPAERRPPAGVRGPEADRVDPQPPIGGLLRRFDGIRAGVARAVGQQHDDRRGVGALRDGRRRASPTGRSGRRSSRSTGRSRRWRRSTRGSRCRSPSAGRSRASR